MPTSITAMTISRPRRVSRLTSFESSDVSMVTSKRPFWYWSSHFVVASLSVGMRSATWPATPISCCFAASTIFSPEMASSAMSRSIGTPSESRPLSVDRARATLSVCTSALTASVRSASSRRPWMRSSSKPSLATSPKEITRPVPHVPPDATGEVTPEGLLVDGTPERRAHPAQRVGHALHAALLGDDHELAETQPLLQVELTHHPEVDEGEHARVQIDEQVAGVRVGVEEAVHRELLDERAERIARDQVAVEARRLDRLDVAGLDPLHELLRDDLGGREVAVDGRHVHAGQALHVLGEAEGVVGLATVVELLEDARRELLEHADDVQ